MGFTDQLKAALKKKQALHHPEADDAVKDSTKEKRPKQQVPVNKPAKKVTGRGR